ncbi:hypothetical protein [Cephaloticoccus primus]|uniref:hypothetical protein n=1 Tax=Cephaloticoccus primus TaxID=1548207 RepID=UPI0012E8A0D0|nr:hypothetical protein [Cephaloticoccus primus]
MKKMKLISSGVLVFGVASFIAYSNGAHESGNNSQVSNKSLVEDGGLLENISFEGVFDGLVILPDFSVPITEQEGVKEILLKQVGEILGHFNRNLKEGGSISYNIVHNGDELSFVDFNVVEGKSGDKQGSAPVLDEDCPPGLTFIKVCYSKSCVEGILEELAKDFSKGEIVYLRHNGLGGVVICSDVR